MDGPAKVMRRTARGAAIPAPIRISNLTANAAVPSRQKTPNVFCQAGALSPPEGDEEAAEQGPQRGREPHHALPHVVDEAVALDQIACVAKNDQLVLEPDCSRPGCDQPPCEPEAEEAESGPAKRSWFQGECDRTLRRRGFAFPTAPAGEAGSVTKPGSSDPVSASSLIGSSMAEQASIKAKTR